MKEKKIIFMGTPIISSSYLQSLLNNKFNVVSVFTQPPRKKDRGMKLSFSPTYNLANKFNIKVHYPDKLDNKTFEIMKSYNPDLIIVMAYGLIIPSNILDLPKFGCINIHVSLLPRWRGASPIEHTLLSGDNETGISIIKIINKLDAGPILVQKKIQVEEKMNKEELTNNLVTVGTKLLIDFLPDLFDRKVVEQNQNEKQVTYASKINSTMTKINFNSTSTKVFNQIRAYSPNPGAWFSYKNERIKILSASITDTKSKPDIIASEKFELGCLDKCILPTYIQREGKKVMTIEDFIRGLSFTVGDHINV